MRSKPLYRSSTTIFVLIICLSLLFSFLTEALPSPIRLQLISNLNARHDPNTHPQSDPSFTNSSPNAHTMFNNLKNQTNIKPKNINLYDSMLLSETLDLFNNIMSMDMTGLRRVLFIPNIIDKYVNYDLKSTLFQSYTDPKYVDIYSFSLYDHVVTFTSTTTKEDRGGEEIRPESGAENDENNQNFYSSHSIQSAQQYPLTPASLLPGASFLLDSARLLTDDLNHVRTAAAHQSENEKNKKNDENIDAKNDTLNLYLSLLKSLNLSEENLQSTQYPSKLFISTLYHHSTSAFPLLSRHSYLHSSPQGLLFSALAYLHEKRIPSATIMLSLMFLWEEVPLQYLSSVNQYDFLSEQNVSKLSNFVQNISTFFSFSTSKPTQINTKLCHLLGPTYCSPHQRVGLLEWLKGAINQHHYSSFPTIFSSLLTNTNNSINQRSIGPGSFVVEYGSNLIPSTGKQAELDVSGEFLYFIPRIKVPFNKIFISEKPEKSLDLLHKINFFLKIEKNINKFGIFSIFHEIYNENFFLNQFEWFTSLQSISTLINPFKNSVILPYIFIQSLRSFCGSFFVQFSSFFSHFSRFSHFSTPLSHYFLQIRYQIFNFFNFLVQTMPLPNQLHDFLSTVLNNALLPSDYDESIAFGTPFSPNLDTPDSPQKNIQKTPQTTLSPTSYTPTTPATPHPPLPEFLSTIHDLSNAQRLLSLDVSVDFSKNPLTSLSTLYLSPPVSFPTHTPSFTSMQYSATESAYEEPVFKGVVNQKVAKELNTRMMPKMQQNLYQDFVQSTNFGHKNVIVQKNPQSTSPSGKISTTTGSKNDLELNGPVGYSPLLTDDEKRAEKNQFLLTYSMRPTVNLNSISFLDSVAWWVLHYWDPTSPYYLYRPKFQDGVDIIQVKKGLAKSCIPLTGFWFLDSSPFFNFLFSNCHLSTGKTNTIRDWFEDPNDIDTGVEFYRDRTPAIGVFDAIKLPWFLTVRTVRVFFGTVFGWFFEIFHENSSIPFIPHIYTILTQFSNMGYDWYWGSIYKGVQNDNAVALFVLNCWINIEGFIKSSLPYYTPWRIIPDMSLYIPERFDQNGGGGSGEGNGDKNEKNEKNEKKNVKNIIQNLVEKNEIDFVSHKNLNEKIKNDKKLHIDAYETVHHLSYGNYLRNTEPFVKIDEYYEKKSDFEEKMRYFFDSKNNQNNETKNIKKNTPTPDLSLPSHPLLPVSTRLIKQSLISHHNQAIPDISSLNFFFHFFNPTSFLPKKMLKNSQNFNNFNNFNNFLTQNTQKYNSDLTYTNFKTHWSLIDIYSTYPIVLPINDINYDVETYNSEKTPPKLNFNFFTFTPTTYKPNIEIAKDLLITAKPTSNSHVYYLLSYIYDILRHVSPDDIQDMTGNAKGDQPSTKPSHFEQDSNPHFLNEYLTTPYNLTSSLSHLPPQLNLSSPQKSTLTSKMLTYLHTAATLGSSEALYTIGHLNRHGYNVPVSCQVSLDNLKHNFLFNQQLIPMYLTNARSQFEIPLDHRTQAVTRFFGDGNNILEDNDKKGVFQTMASDLDYHLQEWERHKEPVNAVSAATMLVNDHNYEAALNILLQCAQLRAGQCLGHLIQFLISMKIPLPRWIPNLLQKILPKELIHSMVSPKHPLYLASSSGLSGGKHDYLGDLGGFDGKALGGEFVRPLEANVLGGVFLSKKQTQYSSQFLSDLEKFNEKWAEVENWLESYDLIDDGVDLGQKGPQRGVKDPKMAQIKSLGENREKVYSTMFGSVLNDTKIDHFGNIISQENESKKTAGNVGNINQHFFEQSVDQKKIKLLNHPNNSLVEKATYPQYHAAFQGLANEISPALIGAYGYMLIHGICVCPDPILGHTALLVGANFKNPFSMSLLSLFFQNPDLIFEPENGEIQCQEEFVYNDDGDGLYDSIEEVWKGFSVKNGLNYDDDDKNDKDKKNEKDLNKNYLIKNLGRKKIGANDNSTPTSAWIDNFGGVTSHIVRLAKYYAAYINKKQFENVIEQKFEQKFKNSHKNNKNAPKKDEKKDKDDKSPDYSPQKPLTKRDTFFSNLPDSHTIPSHCPDPNSPQQRFAYQHLESKLSEISTKYPSLVSQLLSDCANSKIPLCMYLLSKHQNACFLATASLVPTQLNFDTDLRKWARKRIIGKGVLQDLGGIWNGDFFIDFFEKIFGSIFTFLNNFGNNFGNFGHFGSKNVKKNSGVLMLGLLAFTGESTSSTSLMYHLLPDSYTDQEIVLVDEGEYDQKLLEFLNEKNQFLGEKKMNFLKEKLFNFIKMQNKHQNSVYTRHNRHKYLSFDDYMSYQQANNAIQSFSNKNLFENDLFDVFFEQNQNDPNFSSPIFSQNFNFHDFFSSFLQIIYLIFIHFLQILQNVLIFFAKIFDNFISKPLYYLFSTISRLFSSSPIIHYTSTLNTPHVSPQIPSDPPPPPTTSQTYLQSSSTHPFTESTSYSSLGWLQPYTTHTPTSYLITQLHHLIAKGNSFAPRQLSRFLIQHIPILVSDNITSFKHILHKIQQLLTVGYRAEDQLAYIDLADLHHIGIPHADIVPTHTYCLAPSLFTAMYSVKYHGEGDIDIGVGKMGQMNDNEYGFTHLDYIPDDIVDELLGKLPAIKIYDKHREENLRKIISVLKLMKKAQRKQFSQILNINDDILTALIQRDPLPIDSNTLVDGNNGDYGVGNDFGPGNGHKSDKSDKNDKNDKKNIFLNNYFNYFDYFSTQNQNNNFSFFKNEFNVPNTFYTPEWIHDALRNDISFKLRQTLGGIYGIPTTEMFFFESKFVSQNNFFHKIEKRPLNRGKLSMLPNEHSCDYMLQLAVDILYTESDDQNDQNDQNFGEKNNNNNNNSEKIQQTINKSQNTPPHMICFHTDECYTPQTQYDISIDAQNELNNQNNEKKYFQNNIILLSPNRKLSSEMLTYQEETQKGASVWALNSLYSAFDTIVDFFTFFYRLRFMYVDEEFFFTKNFKNFNFEKNAEKNVKICSKSFRQIYPVTSLLNPIRSTWLYRLLQQDSVTIAIEKGNELFGFMSSYFVQKNNTKIDPKNTTKIDPQKSPKNALPLPPPTQFFFIQDWSSLSLLTPFYWLLDRLSAALFFIADIFRSFFSSISILNPFNLIPFDYFTRPDAVLIDNNIPGAQQVPIPPLNPQNQGLRRNVGLLDRTNDWLSAKWQAMIFTPMRLLWQTIMIPIDAILWGERWILRWSIFGVAICFALLVIFELLEECLCPFRWRVDARRLEAREARRAQNN